MHVLIINGSPRVKKFSNTDKILDKFCEGLSEKGNSYLRYEISDRRQWETIRQAWDESNNILIALPLYVECIPGLLLEFLETVTPHKDDADISFILQSGFAEGCQLRCGEEYLKLMSKHLGCRYKGTLVKGDNFSIRFFEDEKRDRITTPYKRMGQIYGEEASFDSEECKAFTGPEVFPAYVRVLVGLMFKTVARKSFEKISKEWGCTKPLDYRPYGT
ncbi:MAG: hypothetical protein IJ757_02655 [Clostridiales bacterium]|nr:hypothetical protein [Clostridiales bacterium]